jgi:pimeloyl-ACP methyl ester carboxylesterase
VSEFALVHGGMHGSWCWESFTPYLRRRGHHVITTDHPGDNVALGSGDYASLIVDQIAELGPNVVVVGHSMGGLAIPLIPRQRPVGALVLLCALVPDPPGSFVDQTGAMDPAVRDPSVRVPDPHGRMAYTPESARRFFYRGVDRTTADRCVARLVPQAVSPLSEPTPLRRWPEVSTFSVFCNDDPMVTPSYSASAAARIGATAIEMTGGHSPFLTRPDHLAGTLHLIAGTVP